MFEYSLTIKRKEIQCLIKTAMRPLLKKKETELVKLVPRDGTKM